MSDTNTDEPVDDYGNPISVWQKTPELPRTFRDALGQVGGPSPLRGGN